MHHLTIQLTMVVADATHKGGVLMAEFINPIPQTVEVNGNVLFTDTVVEPCCKVRHRRGSGIFTLKGGRYLVLFSANVSVPDPAEISLALALNGEALQGGIMTVTPTAADALFNVSTMAYVDVPCNCCYTLSVKNISAAAITVDDANLVTIREVQ